MSGAGQAVSRDYVDRAVASECRKITQAPKGQANETLHRGAISLGTMVGAGWLGRAEAEARLKAAAAERGKSESEATATITSGLDWGMRHPRQETVAKPLERAKAHKAEVAARLWEKSVSLGGTLAETYLRERAISCELPRALRFCPAVVMPCGETVPAMVARIEVPVSGEFLGVQRTGLAADGLGKADIETKKASLGRTAGGAVVLGDLRQATLILEGEGIETALSACQATGLPGIATLSSGTLGKPALPEGCSVIVLGDRGSEKAAEAAARRRGAEGREVRIAYPPEGADKDFNDLLKSGGEQAVKAVIDAAELFVPATSSRSYSSRCLADIDAKPVRWLWPKRIALGKLNLLAGHPGRGKSTLTLYIAALVSNGGRWPDASRCPIGNVLFITCEDDPADTLVPRLQAIGANLSRCHLLEAVHDENGKERPFNLKTDVSRVEELARDKSALSLIVIDPISAYLNGIDSHNVAEVRGALVPLQQLAERLGAAVIMVSHFNKGTPDGSAMSRVSGSGAFVAVCRSAWVVERDPNCPDGDRRIFAPMKNNIGDDRTGFAFVVEQCDLGDDIEASRVRFASGSVLISADELVRGQTSTHVKQSAKSRASDFLSELLAGGPMPEAEVERAAKTAGHKIRTIQRAKADLKVQSRKRDSAWWWELPAKHTGPGLFEGQGRQESQDCQQSLASEVGEHEGAIQQDCQDAPVIAAGNLGGVGSLQSQAS